MRHERLQRNAPGVEPARVDVSAADLLAWAKRLESLLTHDDLPDDVLEIVEELMLWCETGYLDEGQP